MSRQATRQFSGALLKAAQAERGIHTEALAREINVSLRLLQKWRAGTTTPSGHNVIALAAALDRHPEAFYINGDKEGVA